ncbi:MAG: nitric oxide synthase [Candidatus Thorarchaeota archaeon]|nr:nitric oxide synthase [Candidatus Thorarchaeota archaeon]
MKTLIVYGTRYGATAKTADEIADVLRNKDIEVKITNAKEEKIKDISEYDFVIVGSGIKAFRWTKEPKSFLKKFRNELRQKKVALFVCAGTWPLLAEDGPLNDNKEDNSNPLEKEKSFNRFLVNVAKEFDLTPVSMGLFGGVWDFDAIKGLWGKIMGGMRKDLEAQGIDTSIPYDNRDIDTIRDWAKKLVVAMIESK